MYQFILQITGVISAWAQTDALSAGNQQVMANKCAGYTNFVARAFCEGDWAMYVILVVGLMALFIIIERGINLGRLAIDKTSLNENVFSLLLRGEVRQAIAYCDRKPAPLTNTIKAGLVQMLNKRSDEEVQVAMDAAVLRETPRLEGWTSFLAVFGNAAVLIGLLGTISGLIKSFRGVADADAAKKATLLSEGISEALNCTAFGLLVAIISIIAYGFFQMRIGKAANDMVESSMTLMNLVASNRDKMKD